MIAATQRFVCAADEVWRLQRGSEADCIFFQSMVNGGKRITDGGSRQGTWVCSAAGVVLARFNTRDVETVLEKLEAAYAAWEALPDEARHLPEDVGLEPEHRWEHNYPEGGLVLDRTVRDLPAEGLDAPPMPRWSRDYAWFSREEVRAMVPREASVGDTFELGLLARRLARFHLVDNARGQSLPFADEEIVEARVTARVVARSGTRVTLHLVGVTRAVAEGPWLLGHNLWMPKGENPRGVACELAGEAACDLESGAFESFELVALARRWGSARNDGRRRDPIGRVAFHLTMAPPGAPRIAPTFVVVYDGEWIEAPAVPTWVRSPEECGLGER